MGDYRINGGQDPKLRHRANQVPQEEPRAVGRSEPRAGSRQDSSPEDGFDGASTAGEGGRRTAREWMDRFGVDSGTRRDRPLDAETIERLNELGLGDLVEDGQPPLEEWPEEIRTKYARYLNDRAVELGVEPTSEEAQAEANPSVLRKQAEDLNEIAKEKGQRPLLTPTRWREQGAGANANRERSHPRESQALEAVGAQNNNTEAANVYPRAEGSRNRNTRPDGRGVEGQQNEKDIFEHKDLSPGEEYLDSEHPEHRARVSLCDSGQLRDQREAATSRGGRHIVALTSDHPLGSDGAPQVRPSGPLGEKSKVYYVDHEGRASHEWTEDGWRGLSAEESAALSSRAPGHTSPDGRDANRSAPGAGGDDGTDGTDGPSGGLRPRNGGPKNGSPASGVSEDGKAGERTSSKTSTTNLASAVGTTEGSTSASRGERRTSGEPSKDDMKTKTEGPTLANRSTQARRGPGSRVNARGSLYKDGLDNVRPEKPPSSFVGPRAGASGHRSLSVGRDGLDAELGLEASAGLYAVKNGSVEGQYGSASYTAQAKVEARAEANASATAGANGVEARARAGASVSVEASVRGSAQTRSVTVAGVDFNASVEGGARVAAEATAEAEGGVQVTRKPPTVIAEGSAGASAVAKAEADVTASAGPFSVTASGYASAGAEAQAEGAVGFKDGKIVLKGGLGAAVGVGLGGDVNVEVDVKQLGTMAVNTVAEAPGVKQVAAATEDGAKAVANGTKAVVSGTADKVKGWFS